MTHTVRLRYVLLRHGQHALGRYYPIAAYDDGAVVQRSVLEKYVFEQCRRHLRVDRYSALLYDAQIVALLDYDERTSLLSPHFAACRNDGLQVERGLVTVGIEETAYEAEFAALTSYRLQEMTYLGLEDDKYRYHANADYLSEDRRQQYQIERAHKYPYQIYDEYPRHDIRRTGSAHGTIYREHDNGHEHDIDEIDERKRNETHIVNCYSPAKL